MARIKYEEWRPGAEARRIVEQANDICADYLRQGYSLTLRQIYYQFVARGLIDNNVQSYKKLGEIINRARLAGLMDWRYVEDRMRSLRGTTHWDDPSGIIRSAMYGYHVDKWTDQPRRVEIWVEKDALSNVVNGVAARYDVDYFACRGYVSQSELWKAGQRVFGYLAGGQAVTILHLGDHDPSGVDMTRDITDRLMTFVRTDFARDSWYLRGRTHITTSDVDDAIRDSLGLPEEAQPVEIRRIALTMDQVRTYNPPPNPAKITDSRCVGYMDQFGRDSWELDALNPSTLDDLISEHIEDIRVRGLYDARASVEQQGRTLLRRVSDRWSDVATIVEDWGDDET